MTPIASAFVACLATFLLPRVSRFSPKKQGRETLVEGMRTRRKSRLAAALGESSLCRLILDSSKVGKIHSLAQNAAHVAFLLHIPALFYQRVNHFCWVDLRKK